MGEVKQAVVDTLIVAAELKLAAEPLGLEVAVGTHERVCAIQSGLTQTHRFRVCDDDFPRRTSTVIDNSITSSRIRARGVGKVVIVAELKAVVVL